MTREAQVALGGKRNPDEEPVVRAAQILADAIDRLNVALTGPSKVDDDGTLGWIARGLGVLAEAALKPPRRG